MCLGVCGQTYPLKLYHNDFVAPLITCEDLMVGELGRIMFHPYCRLCHFYGITVEQ